MTVPQQVADNTYMDRMISTMAAAFAVLATLLAAIGLYGVLAYSVAQRTRGLGVRMALGASTGSVRVLVLKQVAVMTLIGAVLGVGSAFARSRAARSLLYGLEGYDVVTVAGPPSCSAWWPLARDTCRPAGPRESARCRHCTLRVVAGAGIGLPTPGGGLEGRPYDFFRRARFPRAPSPAHRAALPSGARNRSSQVSTCSSGSASTK